MNYNSLNAEDKEWLSRLEDLRQTALLRKVPKFTKFCDERLSFVANSCMSGTDGFCMYGGYSGCERTICGFFPEYIEPDASHFPISLLKIEGIKGCGHRDVLGSVLGLGINRDVIGDILVSDDTAFVFVHKTIEDYILYNLEKVAKYRVKVSSSHDLSEIPKRKEEEIFGTVSSERLDCAVSLLTKKSRGDAQGFINSERVFVNHSLCTSSSVKVKEGDVISVRKFGKARIGQIGPETKKGRICLTLYKYV